MEVYSNDPGQHARLAPRDHYSIQNLRYWLCGHCWKAPEISDQQCVARSKSEILEWLFSEQDRRNEAAEDKHIATHMLQNVGKSQEKPQRIFQNGAWILRRNSTAHKFWLLDWVNIDFQETTAGLSREHGSPYHQAKGLWFQRSWVCCLGAQSSTSDRFLLSNVRVSWAKRRGKLKANVPHFWTVVTWWAQKGRQHHPRRGKAGPGRLQDEVWGQASRLWKDGLSHVQGLSGG